MHELCIITAGIHKQFRLVGYFLVTFMYTGIPTLPNLLSFLFPVICKIFNQNNDFMTNLALLNVFTLIKYIFQWYRQLFQFGQRKMKSKFNAYKRKLLYTISNNTELYEEQVPQTRKTIHHAVSRGEH